MEHRPGSVLLRCLPLFAWVDSFMRWMPILRLPFILSLLLGTCYLLWLLGAELTSLVSVVMLSTLAGASIAVLVILIQGAQTDLTAAEENLTPLLIAPAVARQITVASLLVGIVLIFWFSYAYNGDVFRWLTVMTPDFLARTPTGGIAAEWLLTLGLWINGVVLVHIIMVSRHQVQLFRKVINGSTIELLSLERFQWLVRQPLRFLLITVVLMSLYIVIYQFLRADSNENFLYNTLLPMLLVAIILGVYHLSPLFLLRTRIAEVKAEETRCIRAAIRGDRTALADTQIAHAADEFSTPDLLAYETRVANCREWPVEGALQRILLYGLLPPLAWVLAALVERIIDSVL